MSRLLWGGFFIRRGAGMIYQEVLKRINAVQKLRTKDIDDIAKDYLTRGVDVDDLFPHIDENGALFRIYLVVSLKRIQKYEDQIAFIEDLFPHLRDWWHVDILPQLLKRAPSFDYVYGLSAKYVQSDLLFVRRWGYVIILTGFQKDPSLTKNILNLMHNDAAYYVQMAEAWLIADLAIYNPEEILRFIASRKLNYGIIGKAIQKMCDSFRISDEIKRRARELRALYK